MDTGAHVEEMRHIDLAATIAALLGVEPPAQSEGEPMGWARVPK